MVDQISSASVAAQPMKTVPVSYLTYIEGKLAGYEEQMLTMWAAHEVAAVAAIAAVIGAVIGHIL